MSQEVSIARFILLPELKIETVSSPSRSAKLQIACLKESEAEVCPRCATLSRSIYDHRTVSIKDAPIRGKAVKLLIRKRRFFCSKCRKPFTEPIQGIWPKLRTTQRYRRSVLWACEKFADLKSVHREYRCSYSLLYKVLNEQLDLQVRMRQDPWPTTIGIDEHSFHKRRGPIPFVSIIADYHRKRLLEVIAGKTNEQLVESLTHIPGRENVKNVILDLSDSYKSFAKQFFPNAALVADKFHVLRLLTPHINRTRKEITGDRRSLRIRKLLLMNSKRIDPHIRFLIWQWLNQHPTLKELYRWKERLSMFYRIKGYNRACRAFGYMLEEMKTSTLKEIQTLYRTFSRWKSEILNYFKTNLTNARTEGFNNKAKVIKRRAYGYRNFTNYRLRLLCACY